MSGHDPLEWMKKADADLDMAGRALQGKKKHPDSGAITRNRLLKNISRPC